MKDFDKNKLITLFDKDKVEKGKLYYFINDLGFFLMLMAKDKLEGKNSKVLTGEKIVIGEIHTLSEKAITPYPFYCLADYLGYSFLYPVELD